MKWLSFLLTASTVTAPVGAAAMTDVTLMQPGVTSYRASLTSSMVEITHIRGIPKVVSIEDLEKQIVQESTITYLLADPENPAKLKAKRELVEKLKEERAAKIKFEKTYDSAMEELLSYDGVTWYVYSGSTPRGWDCSGLVMWFYGQFNIELEHSANAQMNSGTITKDPLPGDIVAFSYNGSKRSYHVGIYLGDGQMIHAPRPGRKTTVEDISEFAGSNSKYKFVRVFDY
jgi:cell wall-associated NlpC family hydrolase